VGTLARLASLCSAIAVFSASVAFAQTTDGLISGRIIDSSQGTRIKGANVFYWSAETNVSGVATTDASGHYVLPLLSPGIYRVRAEIANYQAKELQELEVPVSGRLGVDFELRPLADVWEAGIYRSVLLPGSKVIVTFYGPDLDESKAASIDTHRSVKGALETTISHVIFPEEVQNLPLSGRDVYATLVMEPGVTTDISTGRGLGLAVNGQRATASNFLLDGIENNDALATGPLNPVSPEAVQEYRISTSNFSAEFGRTSGYIADAVTRGGGAAWHGLAYYYLENEALNANDFSRNLKGLPRGLNRDVQPGFSFGGPLLKDRLFVALSAEYSQFSSRAAPAQFRLPTTAFYTLFRQSPNRTAVQLLNLFPAPFAPIDPNTGTEKATIARPSEQDRFIALPRVDYLLKGGVHRFMARAIVSKLDLPDFIWTPFQDFITPLNRKTIGMAFAATSAIRPNLTNEARFGWNSDSLNFTRRWPDIPTLVSFDVSNPLWLPGSPAFYGFQSHNHYEELQDNLIWVRGSHVMKFGGGILLRQLQGVVDPGNFIVFQNFASFYLDQTRYFFAPANRLKPGTLDTNFARNYRYNQLYLFAQDSFKVNRRLTVDYGVRYERYGAPVNTGATKDVTVKLGQGNSLPERIAGASLQPGPSGDQSLYDTDNKDFALRAGFSLNLRHNGQTVLRGSYGIFYDRPFDNLFETLQANNFYLGVFNAVNTNYLAPLSTILPAILASPNQTLKVPDLTLYQPGLKNGRVQSYFLGLQHEVHNGFLIELNATGSMDRNLITTDVLNRSTAATAFGKNEFNNSLPTLTYRSSQGSSDYHAFTALGRYRSDHLQAQVAYTLSHSIDNQSDPLQGGFFNFLFTGGKDDGGQPLGGNILNQLLQGGVPSPVAAFTREFDSHGDRANSDFDQRHNLVGYVAYQEPRLFAASRFSPVWNGWAVSMLGAVRSGFPYTVYSPLQSGGLIYNNTANLIGNPYLDTNVTGGRLLLNSAAFQSPAANVAGNTARNEFRGPGVASMDLSLSRSFGLKWLGEGGHLTLRADAYNFLNHANLNNPAAMLNPTTVFQKTFGVATYGRQDSRSGFPSSVPLDETSRQIQLMVKLNF
jgi:hypothetical protein